MEALFIFLMRVVVAPGLLGYITMMVLDGMGTADASGAVFVVCWLVWLVIINGGFLILDGDLFD